MCNGPLYVDSCSPFQLLRSYSHIDIPSDFKRSHNLPTVEGFESNSLIISSQLSPLKSKVSSDSNTNHGTIFVNRPSGLKRIKNSTPFSSGLRVINSFEANYFANLVESQVNNGAIVDRGDYYEIASKNNNFQHPVAKSLPMIAKNSGDSSAFRIERLQYILNRRQRGEKRPIPDEQKDDKYFERRKRNNEAAKKSRDARKIREDRIALRATLLEQENAILKAQIFSLREELLVLQQMICNRANIKI